jgi:hypothetical protein
MTEQPIWAAVQGTQTKVAETTVAFAGANESATASKLFSDTVASQVAQLR